MNLRIVTWWLMVLMLAVSAPAHAQSPDGVIRAAVKDGEKVRITLDGGREFKGRIVARATSACPQLSGRIATRR